MKNTIKFLTNRLKIAVPSVFMLMILSFGSSAQWTTNGTNIYNSNTGNVGIGTTAPASKFQSIGESRFGSATNYLKVASTGALSFTGTGNYQVANNKYFFKHVNSGNRGLYVSKDTTRFELRDSTSGDLFHVNYYNGNAYIKSRLGVGTGADSVSNIKLEGANGVQVQLTPGTNFTKYYFLQNKSSIFTIKAGTSSGPYAPGDSTRFSIITGGRVGFHANPGALWSTWFVVWTKVSEGQFTQTGWMHNSDRRLKTNIKPLENSLDKILKLQGVSFNWKCIPNVHNQIGFIAQDVEKIFPEVVVQGTNGDLAMANQNLVAPVVEAIKEQQKLIEEKEAKIKKLKAAVVLLQNENAVLKTGMDNLENGLSQCCMNANAREGNIGLGNEDIAKLEQNSPNPFNEKTIVRCYIPQSASNSVIRIYSIKGEEIKSIPVNAKGISQLEIEGSTLSAGTYNYLLIIDGKTIDRKLMIVTK